MTKGPRERHSSSDSESSDFSHVGLLTSPLLTLRVLLFLLIRYIRATLSFMLHHKLPLLALLSAIAAFELAPGP